MRRLIVAGALALLPMLPPQAAGAQERQGSRRDAGALNERTLPREVRDEVVRLYNASGTLRANGRLDIPEERTVHEDVAVLGGPLTVSGTIRGRVVVINADLILRPTARIDGDVLVVGGVVEGRRDAYLGGELRIYRQVLRDYREDGDRIVVERERDDRAAADEDRDDDDDDRWRNNRRRRYFRSWSRSELKLVTARTYNRVEGLPVLFGPRIRTSVGGLRTSAELFGVFRTGDDLKWTSENIGHSARAEIRLGRGAGLAVGGHLFDLVEGVEEWHLTDAEVGLASFFLHRDYRDYFNRHGGAAFARLLLADEVSLTGSFSDQRWGSRRTLDPWTLFRNNNGWRINPAMDEGRFHIANGTLQIDTRNDPDDPWSGWYIVADYEHGTGRVEKFGERSSVFGTGAIGLQPSQALPQRLQYNRGFLDLRRYNRLAPNTQLNFRIVAGGWLSGDSLPLQRRFSVGGPGSLPGYDFRETPIGAGVDYFQCSRTPAAGEVRSTAPGAPAECDRMAMAQAEYRGDLNFDFNLFGDDDDEDDEDWRFRVDTDAQWVVFADAGRGWRVGPQGVSGDGRFAKDEFPALRTFRTDIGLGLQTDVIGFYVAKSVSDSEEPANFFVRVRKRF
jgi:hypothetical protein